MPAINLPKKCGKRAKLGRGFRACRRARNARTFKEITYLSRITLKGAKPQDQSSQIL